MQKDNFNEESFWDDLDDSDFELCIQKENEFLTQNPSAQRKDVKTNSITKEISSQWINENFNSFNAPSGSNAGNKISTQKFSTSSKEKKSSSSSFNINNAFSNVSKKTNFYKPLDLGSSTSTFNAKIPLEKKEMFETNSGMKSVHGQLELALKEKAKLEEENLLKQGEVSNLRCELKRKEASVEAERVDQCIALEAAEKRGKEKASKIITEMEQKVKSLDKEVDRLQGNLTFKNREVEELLEKCKFLEQKTCVQSSPSAKRRKIDSKVSPYKTNLNFAERFDFGDLKKVTKNAQVQTECDAKVNRRIFIKIHSRRGYSSGSRRVYHLLSSSQQTKELDSKPHHDESTPNQSTLLAQMIFSETSPSEAEHQLVKGACSDLEALLKKASRDDMLPKMRFLSVTHSGSENVSQNGLKILSQCLSSFLEESANCIIPIISALESLSSLSNQCSNIPPDICHAVVDALRKCCQVSAKEVIQAFFTALNSLLNFEIFKQKMCINSRVVAEVCLLKKVCNLFHTVPNSSWTNETNNEVISFVAKLLHDPKSITYNKDCNCSSSLLVTFVNHLFRTSQSLLEDKCWYPVLNGVKVLHLWQSKDKTWWDKALALHSYTALMSTVVRKSKYLKMEGILDQHTMELLYDLYDLDE